MILALEPNNQIPKQNKLGLLSFTKFGRGTNH